MSAKIALIAAVAENGVIGAGNDLPWKIKSEFAYFFRMTKGKPLIMGRKTFESVNGPLKNRPNIVITRDAGFKAAEGVTVVHDMEAALEAGRRFAQDRGVDEVMVGGGAEIYRLSLPFADRLYLTEVHLTPAGETKFPAFDRSQWIETKREFHEKLPDEAAGYTITVLDKA